MVVTEIDSWTKHWQLMRSLGSIFILSFKNCSVGFSSDSPFGLSRTSILHLPQIPSPLQEDATGTLCSSKELIKLLPTGTSICLFNFGTVIVGINAPQNIV